MKNFQAFLKGLREFRMLSTTHYEDDLIDSYDRGREAAHRVTLRKFEP